MNGRYSGRIRNNTECIVLKFHYQNRTRTIGKKNNDKS